MKTKKKKKNGAHCISLLKHKIKYETDLYELFAMYISLLEFKFYLRTEISNVKICFGIKVLIYQWNYKYNWWNSIPYIDEKEGVTEK